MSIQLSFIIPVYNAEAYLKECLESILSQSSGECEVILVNDGSCDGSGTLCAAYAEKYSNVSAIHKENGGPSLARELGVGLAKGEFLCFVDADDRIAPNSVSRILEWIKAGGADICFMEAEKFFPNGHRESLGDGISPEGLKGKNKQEIMHYLSNRPKFPGSPCTKILRKSFLQQNGIAFPTDRRYAEDLGYVMDCLLKAESYDALSCPYYEYRQGNQNSRSNQLVKSFYGMAAFVVESVEILTKSKQPKDEISKSAMSFVAYEYSIMLWRCSLLEKEETEKALTFLRDYRWVMKYGTSKKTRAIWLVINIFGIQITSKMLNVYMTLK